VAEGGAVAIYVQRHGLAHGPGGVFKGDIFGRKVIALHQHRLRRVGVVAGRVAGVVGSGNNSGSGTFAHQPDARFVGRHHQLFAVGARPQADGNRHLRQVAHRLHRLLNGAVVAAAIGCHRQQQ